MAANRRCTGKSQQKHTGKSGLRSPRHGQTPLFHRVRVFSLPTTEACSAFVSIVCSAGQLLLNTGYTHDGVQGVVFVILARLMRSRNEIQKESLVCCCHCLDTAAVPPAHRDNGNSKPSFPFEFHYATSL